MRTGGIGGNALNITRVSAISLYGCGASGAYALGPHTKKEEEEEEEEEHTQDDLLEIKFTNSLSFHHHKSTALLVPRTYTHTFPNNVNRNRTNVSLSSCSSTAALDSLY